MTRKTQTTATVTREAVKALAGRFASLSFVVTRERPDAKTGSIRVSITPARGDFSILLDRLVWMKNVGDRRLRLAVEAAFSFWAVVEGKDFQSLVLEVR